MKLDWVRNEITRMRGHIRAQQREKLTLQRAGVAAASAELLLTRMRAKAMTSAASGMPSGRERRSHAKLSWVKANLLMRRRVDISSGKSARSGAATVAEPRTPRHSGLRPSICDRRDDVGSESDARAGSMERSPRLRVGWRKHLTV